MTLLWLTTMIPQARPPRCNESSSNCNEATSFQTILLCSCLGIMSIGAGGIRATCMAFGADQLTNLTKEGTLQTYFSWYFALCSISVLIGNTFIVYIQDNIGWQLGFSIPPMVMLLATVPFFLAYPFFIKLKVQDSLFTGLIQAIVASYKNRNIPLSSDNNMLYHHKKGSTMVSPSEKLRYDLNFIMHFVFLISRRCLFCYHESV